jgi:hypothetical protein
MGSGMFDCLFSIWSVDDHRECAETYYPTNNNTSNYTNNSTSNYTNNGSNHCTNNSTSNVTNNDTSNY